MQNSIDHKYYLMLDLDNMKNESLAQCYKAMDVFHANEVPTSLPDLSPLIHWYTTALNTYYPTDTIISNDKVIVSNGHTHHTKRNHRDNRSK